MVRRDRPAAAPKADPARQWERFNRSQAIIAELARDFRGARRTANFQNYERTLTPKLVDIYRREGVCWVVTGSTQYGRATAEPYRAPEALRYYRALRREADVGSRRARSPASSRATRSTSPSTTSTARSTARARR